MLLQEARKKRIHKIISKLTEIGLEISYEDILDQIGEGVSAGRPHCARVLVAKGYVNSVSEAFDKYLGEGKPGYVKRETIEPKEAMSLIHSAKGTAVLPHPLLVEDTNLEKLRYYLDLLLEWGLEGIEIYYNYKYHCPFISDNKVKRGVRFLKEYCRKHDLLMTGGSDFHQYKPIFGNIAVPEDDIKKLLEHFTS